MAFGLDSLSISASGLTAQQFRMDVISNNIANADTTQTPEGGPYRREMVVLTPAYAPASSFADALQQASGAVGGTTAGVSDEAVGAGVQVAGVVQDPSPFQLVYDPTNPDAVNGYVEMPNVDISTEMVDMMSAQQAYQANVTAFDAGKQMDMDALTIGQ
ncbi:flagellar basal body rod protein FlgC [Alicyclobacillus cycloheptanicus]|uniref:Flagellar basal-body rod protein FlgC n=1 Tax=Alicyclobacillus cycloheptanicus TaxID=1457 RepID=A0ABT9XLC5_9BACL|nr:flagellar basal body rod protein FlgC [Alicyclobacillus cycloheptanicus]MDQ0190563.1 flagellar basal-body rod protein FlgC [Alicyclobacillus cycloheptanicus]WDM01404.1 flagellar basal body rod protein FlgC [Alicyclobacillus cycloheptanicus]